jgi:hypothetical protein
LCKLGINLLVDAADRPDPAALSTEPVTAKDWLIGASASAESKAKSSAAEALSPSTPL